MESYNKKKKEDYNLVHPKGVLINSVAKLEVSDHDPLFRDKSSPR